MYIYLYKLRKPLSRFRFTTYKYACCLYGFEGWVSCFDVVPKKQKYIF